VTGKPQGLVWPLKGSFRSAENEVEIVLHPEVPEVVVALHLEAIFRAIGETRKEEDIGMAGPVDRVMHEEPVDVGKEQILVDALTGVFDHGPVIVGQFFVLGNPAERGHVLLIWSLAEGEHPKIKERVGTLSAHISGVKVRGRRIKNVLLREGVMSEDIGHRIILSQSLIGK
jgi:hypothetical protein